MTIQYTSLDEVGTDYISATQDETEALFHQGEIVLTAIHQGFQVKEVVYHCASLTRRKARTVFHRYAVAKTFPADKRDDSLDWTMHSLCAGTSAPYKWLEIASEGYLDANGDMKGHTCRTLKAAIKAAGGDPDKDKPVYLFDNIEATVNKVYSTSDGMRYVEFRVGDMLPARIGTKVTLTVLQTIAVEVVT